MILEKCDELDSIVDIKLIQENAFEEIVKEIGKYKSEKNDMQSELSKIYNDNKQMIPEYPQYFLKNVGSRPYFFSSGK